MMVMEFIFGELCVKLFTMGERVFIERCLNRDKAAWSEFLSKYSNLIYNYIYHVFKVKGVRASSDKASEFFQQIFSDLIEDDFRKLRQFKGKNNATLASWLRMVTINSCLNYLRKEKKVRLNSLDQEDDDQNASLVETLVDFSDTADELLVKAESAQHLTECIEALNRQDKYLLEMHIYQGLHLEDLQVTLGISRSAVDMRKSRLIQKLRDCFKKKGVIFES